MEAKQAKLSRRHALKTSVQLAGLSGLLAGCSGLGRTLEPEMSVQASTSTADSTPLATPGKPSEQLSRQGPSQLPASSSNDRQSSDKRLADEQLRSSSLRALELKNLPGIHREFRAAWVASVNNIDWPSKPGLSSQALRAEIERLCAHAKLIGLNALIVQIRPSADALYLSDLEPSSEFLVGQQGAALADGFDPLNHWIESCKKTGLEFHAWFNPFRARVAGARSGFHAKHLAKQQAQLVVKYAEQWWMNPAEPKALAWTLTVIEDVISRYDIDGVHLDDYFYPYPVQSQDKKSALDFPDAPQFKRYLRQGGKLSKADWRRSHVDSMVAKLYERVRRQKPWIRVGISPFGLGKPSLRPAGIQGFSQFDQLFADVERWCTEGWFDYLAPQLYWKIDHKAQAFEVLLDYWAQRIAMKRHLWPGIYTSSIAQSGRMWPPKEILDQIKLQRLHANANGHIHFSMTTLLNDREGIATSLRKESYKQSSLVPASPWLARGRPEIPQLIEPDQRGVLRWEPPLGSLAWGRTPVRWVLHERTDPQEAWSISHGDVQFNPVVLKPGRDYVLRLLNRVGEASEALAFTWNP